MTALDRNAAIVVQLASALPAVAVAQGIPAEIPENMRPITEIIVHCSATPAGRDVSVAELRRWHRARGFADVGYHYVVHLDGTVEAGRPLILAGAHCRGHNARSIGVCYIGGCDSSMNPADTRTPSQRAALRELLTALRRMFPGAVVRGHRDFAAKACPSFDATAEYSTL